MNEQGYSRKVYVKDGYGRNIAWSFFGIRGDPVIENNEHYHRVTRKLDARGNALEAAVFGLDGKPIEVVDPASGRHCARFIRRFDANNKAIESQCFDASGQPVLEEKGAGLPRSASDP